MKILNYKKVIKILYIMLSVCLIITGTVCAEYDGIQMAGEEKAVSQIMPFTNVVISDAAKIYRVGCLRLDRVSTGSLFEFTTGSAYDQARAELADPSNFGSGGIVDMQFQLLPGIYDITIENLADIDIFWAGSLRNDDPLSIDEQQAILDFVKDGKSLVVIADVGPNYSTGPNTVAAPFGLVWDNSSWIDANPSIIDTLHPIINGPFGVVNEIAHASEGSIADLGLYASEIAINVNGSSIAYIPPDALEPGSGPVVFFSDINEFTSNYTPWGPGFDRGNNRILFKNLFTYLGLASAKELTVEIDIKPNSCPNLLNIKSQGVIPVAILGSENFDVNEINPDSIQLLEVTPIRYNIEDVSMPVDREDDCDCTTEGTDGYEDMILKFKTQEIVEGLGPVNNGEEIVLTLKGHLLDRTEIEGEDCVVISPNCNCSGPQS